MMMRVEMGVHAMTFGVKVRVRVQVGAWVCLGVVMLVAVAEVVRGMRPASAVAPRLLAAARTVVAAIGRPAPIAVLSALTRCRRCLHLRVENARTMSKCNKFLLHCTGITAETPRCTRCMGSPEHCAASVLCCTALLRHWREVQLTASGQ